MGKRISSITLKSEMSEAELSALRGWLRDVDGCHLEIGTAAGGTLCFMMQCYPSSQRPPFVVVDTMAYFDNQLSIIKQNLTNHGLDVGSVDFRVMTSELAFSQAKAAGERFGFILVDASHKICHVLADLRWMHLLNAGGVACLHDYSAKFKGVQWSVDRFLERNPNYSRVGLIDSLICVRKDSGSKKSEITLLDRIWARLWAPLLQIEPSIKKRLGSIDKH